MVRFTLSMQSDSNLDFGGPHFGAQFSACLEAARLIVSRYRAEAPADCDPQCKGGDNGAAIKEQRLAREQSAKQFKVQMMMMARQAEAAASVKTPQILPAAPPQQTNDATIEAARDQKRNSARRFSFNSARMAGSNANKLGGSTVLGGGYTAA